MTKVHQSEFVSPEHNLHPPVGSKLPDPETLFSLLENHHLHSTTGPTPLFFDENAWQKCIDRADTFAMALKLGRIRGIAGIFAHADAQIEEESVHVQLTRELIQGDILVILSGRTIAALNRAGAIEAEHAGDGLKEFCDNLNISPILDMGGVQNVSHFQNFCTLLGQYAGFEPNTAPVGAIIHELHAKTADHVSLYDSAGNSLFFQEVNFTGAAELIDEHIHEKRLALNWCDRYHCSIFS